MAIDAFDERETYCRTLGHAVPFQYCREVNQGLPCRLVADCWYTQFDAAGWLREHFTAEQITQITAPPAPKLTSLVELIEQAKASQPPK